MSSYAIKRCIYEGDWSQVFLATDARTERDVVVKQLRELYPRPESLARFHREFEITRSAQGPHVIEAYELRVDQGTVAIALEDFGGRSVAEVLRGDRLDPLEALPLAIQVADGLAHIHKRNIVHKDVNPANVVWNPQTGVAKLIDFGISQVLSRAFVSPRRPRAFSGTPAYMAPEQTGRMNRDVDCRSDLYSLGVMLYELLTGRRPFGSEDALELVHSHIARSPLPPSELGIAGPLSELVMVLLSKRPEDRYGSAAALSHDLSRCREQLRAGRLTGFPLRARDADGRLRIPQRLYGREAETGRLLAAFEEVASGAVGVVLVAGYSGVGKTSLVHEVHGPLTQRQGLFVEGKFDQLNRGTPYDSLIQAFRGFLRETLTESEEVIAGWRASIRAAVGENGRVLVEVIPELEHLLGPQPEVEELGGREARNRFQLLMGRFLGALGSAEHPLVLFLDDLQWADLPTLELIRCLAGDPDTHHVLFLGAYRDNEVTPSHPLMSTLAGLEADGGRVETIRLEALREEDVLKLVGDTVDQASGFLRLALVCHAKTRGNAFFLNRFLENLHTRELLRFEAGSGHWTWDLEAIQNESVTENVVEFMTAEIQRLDPSARRMLQAAACLGNLFDLSALADALASPRKAVFEGLRGALETSLIQPVDESFWFAQSLPEESTDFRYRFAHDRIQQAAYGMLATEEADGLHLRIGRLLLQRLEDRERGPELFTVVEHLNRGQARMDDPQEVRQLARLNLLAARRASASAAFEPAHGYFQAAVCQLEPEAWERDYETALAVHLEGARAAYLSGYYPIMDERIEAVLAHGRTRLDRVRAREVRIQAFVSQQELRPAVSLALEVLQELGVHLTAEPPPGEVEAAMTATLARLEGQDPGSLPELSDPEVLAALRIQNSLMSSAYLAAPRLLPLLCCSMVNATLDHGVCQPGIYGFSCLGLVLIPARQVDQAYRLGKMAMRLTERYDDRAIRVKNLHVVGSLINSHVDPLRATLESNREVCRLGLDTGDIEYAGWALHTEVCNGVWAGENLAELAERTRHHVALLEHHKQLPPLACTYQFAQLIENLRGHSADPARLVGPSYDEDAHRDQLRRQSFRGAYFVLAAVAVFCRTLFGRFEEAVALADEAAAYEDGATATYHIVTRAQYRALAILAGAQGPLPDGGGGRPPSYTDLLERVRPDRERLEAYRRFSPANFDHRVLLLDAEVARLEGRRGDALQLYEQSIEAARQHEYLHEQALANERAGRFLLSGGSRTPARGYLLEAIFLYHRWGAAAKVAQLEEEFVELLAGFRLARPARSSSHGTGTGSLSSSDLDLAAVIRASQAISGEIVLADLVQSLVRLAVEVGGAQRGLLVLHRDGGWEVVCEGHVVGQEIQLRSTATALDAYPQCPEKVLAYVRRTHEAVILADAAGSDLFGDDPYLQRRASRSLLCLPVKQKNQLNALLYLENDLATGAFSHQQVDLLRVLAGQAAISLENAHLYNTLERRVEERTRELQQEIKERIKAQDELRVLATTDSLTGANNRRHFLELAEQEFRRVRRYPAPLSVLMLDADHFKSINDRYGHEVGDRVLRSLAETISAELRSTEIFGRLGGEEFAVVLPATPSEGAQVVGERIRRAVAELAVSVGEGALRFSVSLGLAEVGPEDDSFAAVLQRADQALYRAKEGGRNRLVGC